MRLSRLQHSLLELLAMSRQYATPFSLLILNILCQTSPMNRLLILPVLLFTLLVGNPAFSADFDKGWTAYQSGDCATALREWTPLAEQGNTYAQHYLGMMYRRGQGVSQNNVSAHFLGSIAAENGNKMGGYLVFRALS